MAPPILSRTSTDGDTGFIGDGITGRAGARDTTAPAAACLEDPLDDELRSSLFVACELFLGSGAFVSAFDRFAETVGDRETPRVTGRVVVYGGDESQDRRRGRLLSWREMDRYAWV